MAVMDAPMNALHMIATPPTVITSMKICSAGHHQHTMTTVPMQTMMTMRVISTLIFVHIQRH